MPKSRRRRPGPPGQPGARRPSGSSAAPQAAPGARGAVERRSAPALRWLSSKPVYVLPVVTVALLVVGLAAPPAIGAPVLLLLALVVGWLSYLSWPVVVGVQRVLRLTTVGLLLVAALGRAGP